MSEDLCVREFFDLDQAWVRLWFGSQSLSLERINSTMILAPARIPVQPEFSVGTGVEMSADVARDFQVCVGQLFDHRIGRRILDDHHGVS